MISYKNTLILLENALPGKSIPICVFVGGLVGRSGFMVCLQTYVLYGGEASEVTQVINNASVLFVIDPEANE